MSTYKPADSKREEFRKYLEKSGVLDALTKTLVTLYEETDKPQNVFDFVKKSLNVDSESVDIQNLDIDNLHNLIEKLSKENQMLKERLSKYEPNMLTEK